MATDVESSSGGNTMGTGMRGDAPTRELPVAPTAASEDRCVNCGSPLAHDQRYCVECGERRGQSRFPAAQPATEIRSTRVRSVRAPRTPRASSGTTLVAGVGVLLLAIGLGVLIGRIGHDNSNQKAAAAPPQVITVNGGGGSSAAASTAATTTTHAPAVSHGLSGKLKKAAATTAPPSKAVQQKANAAAGKVLGNSKNLAPPTVTTGGSCSNSQAGCQSGHFTGNFFGQ